VFWRQLIGVTLIFDGCPEIFDGCPGYISFVSWRYLMRVLDIFDRFPGDI